MSEDERPPSVKQVQAPSLQVRRFADGHILIGDDEENVVLAPDAARECFRQLNTLLGEAEPATAAERSEKFFDFRRDLEHLINSHSLENGSNTPDYILAEYLVGALKAFDHAVEQREKWHGRGEAAPAPEVP